MYFGPILRALTKEKIVFSKKSFEKKYNNFDQFFFLRKKNLYKKKRIFFLLDSFIVNKINNFDFVLVVFFAKDTQTPILKLV